MVTITICGGGGLGHTCAAMFSQQEDVMVNMLTHHPERWNKTFHVNTPKGIIMGRLTQVTDKPEEVVPISNIILLCLPAFLVEKEIIRLRPYLSENTILGTVVSSSGFFLFCHQHLPNTTKLFGLQRATVSPYSQAVFITNP